MQFFFDFLFACYLWGLIAKFTPPHQQFDDCNHIRLPQVFALLEHIVIKLNFVPFPELASLSIQLESAGREVAALALHTVVQFCNYNSKCVSYYLCACDLGKACCAVGQVGRIPVFRSTQ
jgi:hypothetical protein